MKIVLLPGIHNRIREGESKRTIGDLACLRGDQEC
jgi:hypothetical protein